MLCVVLVLRYINLRRNRESVAYVGSVLCVLCFVALREAFVRPRGYNGAAQGKDLQLRSIRLWADLPSGKRTLPTPAPKTRGPSPPVFTLVTVGSLKNWLKSHNIGLGLQ